MTRLLLGLFLAFALVLPASAAAAPRCSIGKIQLRYRDANHAVLSWRGQGRFRVQRDGLVIGQTRRPRLLVRVSPGQRYRFTVRRLGRRGCKRTRTLSTPLHPPQPPSNLTLSEASETRATLSWQASAAGDRPIRGYQVLREGKTVGQTPNMTLRVNLGVGRQWRLQVVAVDSQGDRSRPSAPITADATHRPPTTPGQLQISDLSDVGATLTWAPSQVRGGRVVGYRVLRDGQVVGQTTGTSMSLTRLYSNRSYAIQVVAVDSYRYLSEPAGIVLNTSPPDPTQGHAHAFVLASTMASFNQLRNVYRGVRYVYPSYFDCDKTTGSMLGRDDPLITDFSQQRQMKLLPRFNCQSSNALHQILTDPDTRERNLSSIIGLVEGHGYDGVQLDYETGYWYDRAAMTSFVAELSARLHARGKLLSMSLSSKTYDSLKHPRSGIFDYPALAPHVDFMMLMVWGIHWQTSAPGGMTDWSWFEKVLTYAATFGPQEFVVGLPMYGFDWPADGGSAHPAKALDWAGVQKLIGETGAVPRFDPDVKESTFSYQGSDGLAHTVWYEDAQGLGLRIARAHELGFGGVALWRLGQEDPALWQHPLLVPGAAWS